MLYFIPLKLRVNNLFIIHSFFKVFLMLILNNFRPNFNAVPLEKWDIFLEKNIQNSSIKFAFFVVDGELFMNAATTFGVRLKQDLLTTFIGITTGKNHFLYDVMEKTIQYILPSGILEKIKKFNYLIQFRESYKAKEKRLKVLTIDDLRFLFTMWMVILGILVIVLLIEISMNYLKNISKNYLGLILMLRSIKIQIIH